MSTSRTKKIRSANSEELLLMSLFGPIEVRRAIARELERRASLNEQIQAGENDQKVAAA